MDIIVTTGMHTVRKLLSGTRGGNYINKFILDNSRDS